MTCCFTLIIWLWYDAPQLADMMYQQPWYLHCTTYFTWNDTRMLLSCKCLLSTVCFLSLDTSCIIAVKLCLYLDISVVVVKLSADPETIGRHLPDGSRIDLMYLDSGNYFRDIGDIEFLQIGNRFTLNDAQTNSLTKYIKSVCGNPFIWSVHFWKCALVINWKWWAT